MSLQGADFYAALIHELKNNLGLLSMTIDSIPLKGDADHDSAVETARLLCQGSVDRLRQALLIYKSIDRAISPAIEAYSPHDLVQGIKGRAEALSRGRLRIESLLQANVPPVWFLDRDLVEMALVNAVHNSLAYARTRILVEAGLLDGCLAISVRDDSDGYPEHILAGAEPHAAAYRSTGTGLGLQFSRLIAHSHEHEGRRGELRLFNDNGAVFSLLLP